MSSELNPVLENLHSDKARLAFLKSIYTPGNIEIADRILAMDPKDSSVLSNETDYANQHNLKDRFVNMAKKCIDTRIRDEHDGDFALQNIMDWTISWGNEEIAKYGMRKLTSKSNTKSALIYAAEIAETFNRPAARKKYLESLLSMQEGGEFPFSAGEILQKLGRFSEAIDKYIASTEGRCSGFMAHALQIAREHVPERLKEVAQKGFDTYTPSTGFTRIYVECAEILERTQEAEKTLVKHSKNVKVEDSPRYYEDFVEALIKFGRNQKAKNLVRKVESNEERAKRTLIHYSFDRSEELAILYHLVGEIGPIKDIYNERIDTRIRENHHPSHTLKDIQQAIELTGDTSFREKEFDLYEMQGEYQKAANLAKELGKPELAQAYNTMYEQVQASKTP